MWWTLKASDAALACMLARVFGGCARAASSFLPPGYSPPLIIVYVSLPHDD